MIGPDDFGLSPIATLAHMARVEPSRHHGAFWAQWHQAVDALTPRLCEFRVPSPDASDASATHWIESVSHVRIGCRLIEPPPGVALRGGLLTLHGYHSPQPLTGEDEDWTDLARRGVLVAAIRLRGYPGSCMDCADYTVEQGGWISRGLTIFTDQAQDLMGTTLAQGVADVVVAARALRAELDSRAGGRRLPLMLHGWSFGGGMGTIAAGQLAAGEGSLARIDRLVLGLPSLGDWPWRAAQWVPPGRSGAWSDVRATLHAHAQREAEILSRLALFDAALHARRITCPALCLLALRDDVVPAPAAAGVVNALRSDPGTRFRFLVPFGHFDGGLRSARRHALFPSCRDEFLDPARPCTQSMSRWIPLLERGERHP